MSYADHAEGPATIDSGGELVEMTRLAERIASVVRPDAVITREAVDPRDPDSYHSDGTDWDMRCERWSLASMSLEGQIQMTARGLINK